MMQLRLVEILSARWSHGVSWDLIVWPMYTSARRAPLHLALGWGPSPRWG
jgi:hypothetical protein